MTLIATKQVKCRRACNLFTISRAICVTVNKWYLYTSYRHCHHLHVAKIGRKFMDSISCSFRALLGRICSDTTRQPPRNLLAMLEKRKMLKLLDLVVLSVQLCQFLPSADKIMHERKFENFIQSQKRLHISPRCNSYTRSNKCNSAHAPCNLANPRKKGAGFVKMPHCTFNARL